MNSLDLKHKALNEQLMGNVRINVIHAHCGPPLSSFGRIPEPSHFNPSWAGVQLDEETREATLTLRDSSAYWETGPPFPHIFGEFSIPCPLDIVDGEEDPYAEWIKDPFHSEFMSQLRIFDHAYRSGSGFSVSLRFAPGTQPLELWLRDVQDVEEPPYPAGFAKINLTLREYEEAILQTKGLRGWQYLFTDVSLREPDMNDIREGLETGLQVLPEIFPDDDFSSLHARLEARL